MTKMTSQMTAVTTRDMIIEQFFYKEISLSKNQTVAVINNYIKGSKKLPYVIDQPVQLTMEGDKCVHIELGSGWQHTRQVTIWYNEYATQKRVRSLVNNIFLEEAAK